jgi:hypothetical protein
MKIETKQDNVQGPNALQKLPARLKLKMYLTFRKCFFFANLVLVLCILICLFVVSCKVVKKTKQFYIQ